MGFYLPMTVFGIGYSLQLMKICFPFPGDTVGGSHVNAAHTMSLLSERGHECIPTLHRHGVLSSWMSDIGREHVILPWNQSLATKGLSGVENIRRVTKPIPCMKRWLRENGFDLVIPTDGRMLVAWSLPARLSGCKLVFHHQTKTIGSFMRKAARLTHKIITISKFTQNNLPASLKGRSVIIANPTPIPEMDRMTSRAKMCELVGVDEASIIIGFVANLTEQKRPMDFVEASGKLRSENRLFPMFGRPTNEMVDTNIKARIKSLDMADRMPRLGFVSNLPEMLGGLDILIAPQIEEGFGRNVAEAMAAGVPVVASNSGGHPEFVQHGETGFLTKPGDVNSIVEAVQALLSNSELATRIGENARDFISDQYSPDTYGDAFNKAITSL